MAFVKLSGCLTADVVYIEEWPIIIFNKYTVYYTPLGRARLAERQRP